MLRRVAADPPEWDVALVVTVQEENNHGGARVTAQRLSPDVAIVIEVTYAGDAPGYAPWGGDVKLGGGPTVFRGPVVSPIVGDALLEIAASDGITVAIETGKATHTRRGRRVHRRRRDRDRDRLRAAPLHAHGRRDRAAVGRRRRVAG